jgi:O-antigen/teichoic acid export membrane protein
VSNARTLYGDASHYLGGQAAALALGFVSFPIFTRVLSVAEYGMLCLTFQVAALAAVLSKMGFQHSIQRFYQEHAASPFPGELRKFYSTLLCGAALCGIAVAVLFIIGLEIVPDSLVSPVFKKVLLLGSLLIFIRGLQPIVMNFLRAQRRTKAFNVVDVLTKGAGIALVCLLLFAWNRSVNAVLLGTVAAELVSVVLAVMFLLPPGMISLSAFDKKLFGGAVAFGFPLVLYELSGVILDSGDRILVQHYMGFEALGYYSAGYNISTYVAMFLRDPVNLAMFPIYMKLWVSRGPEETREFLSATLDNFIMVAMCVLAGVAVTARYAVIVLGSRKLQQAYPLLPVLVLGLMLHSLQMFFNAGLVIHKKTFTMFKFVAASAILNIALNVLLIPRIGLQGAAVATLISYALFLGLCARASSVLLPLRLDILACSRYMGAALISVLLVSRVQCSSDFLNLVVRGGLSVLVYGAVLWGIDRRFRLIVADAIRFAGRVLKKNESELTDASALETRSRS